MDPFLIKKNISYQMFIFTKCRYFITILSPQQTACQSLWRSLQQLTPKPQPRSASQRKSTSKLERNQKAMFYRQKAALLLSKCSTQMWQKAEKLMLSFCCHSFQMQCKLYVFEKTAQSWIERGRGLLRLNDMASTDDGTLQSRLGKHLQKWHYYCNTWLSTQGGASSSFTHLCDLDTKKSC